MLATTIQTVSMLRVAARRQMGRAGPTGILHRPVSVESVRINPYALSLSSEKFAIKEQSGNETFVGFDRLYRC